MCLPRVADASHGAKRADCGRSDSRRGSDAPRDRSAVRRAARRQSAAIEQEVARDDEIRRLTEGCYAASGAASDVYSLELGSSHTGDRRRRHRVAGLVLGEVERERARLQATTAGACGSSYAAYRRYTVAGPGWREDRLVCQRRCGTRACADCDSEIRRRECARVEGDWRLFVTLGVPAARMTCRQAWHRIRRARALLFKRLERHAARSDAWAVRVWDEDAEAARERRAAAGLKRRRKNVLDYAWVLEPHVSGYPHLHFVLNACAVYYPWLKKVWSECIGREVRWIKVKTIFDASGTCRYLSKYLSKSVFTLDLCAVMYRQRMWATSIPQKHHTESAWLEERQTSSDQAASQTHAAFMWPGEDGFKHQSGKAGAYRLWTRWWGQETPRELNTMADYVWPAIEAERSREKREGRSQKASESLWPLFDLLLECAGTFLAFPGSLTKAVKVGLTCARASLRRIEREQHTHRSFEKDKNASNGAECSRGLHNAR